MKKLLLTILFTLVTVNVYAACPGGVCYVQPNGGTKAQCTGGSNADYPGSGTGQNCALKHPFYAIGWYKFADVASPSGGQSGVMTSGDIVVVSPATYIMGNDPSGQTFDCSTSTYGCTTRRVPSGNNDSDRTKIIGCSVNGCGSGSRPKFISTGRVKWQLDLRSRSYIDIDSIELTDSASCGRGHFTLSCGSASLGDGSGEDGIWLSQASNINIKNSYIHGFYRYGLVGGGVNTVSLIDTKIDLNSYGGWNMDDSGNGTCCSNSGNISFLGTEPITSTASTNKCSMNWNGCVENGTTGSPANSGCYSQSVGGYGDAIGTASSSGNFSFIQCDISYNTSDGLDFLYLNKSGQTGGTLTVKRSRMEGNVGNAVKGPNSMTLEDNMILGNCGFHSGQSFSYPGIDTCRASGNTIPIAWRNNSSINPIIYNNTIHGNGTAMILIEGPDTQACPNGTDILVKNNLFIGGRRFNSQTQVSEIFYNDAISKGTNCIPEVIAHDNACAGEFNSGRDCTDANTSNNYWLTPDGDSVYTATVSDVVTGTVPVGQNFYTGQAFIDQFGIKVASIARDLADETLSGDDEFDFNNFDRGASWDSGALEYGTTQSFPDCGNGSIDAGETCDTNGPVITPYTDCTGLGYDSGTLGCTSGCQSYDVSSCVTDPCGNSTIDAGEDCDTANLNSQTCVSQGYSSGTLACDGNCNFNYTSCVSYQCPNGTLDPGEECDDNNSTNGDGCSSLCTTENPNYELFLNYTETDPNTRLAVAVHKVTATGISRNESANLKIDKGVGNIGNFVYDYKLTQDICSDSTASSIEYDAGSEKTQSASTTVTFAHTTANQSNRLLIVNITREEFGTSRTISSVTYNSVSMTKAVGTQTGTGNNKVDTYYLLAPTVGTYNVVITYDGSVGSTAATADSWYNVLQQAPDVIASAVGTSANFTTTSNGSLAVSSIVASISTAVLTTSDTELHNFANTGEHAIGVSSKISNAGSDSMSWGISGGSSAMTVAVFTPVNTGGANPAIMGVLSVASSSHADIKAQDTAGDGFYLYLSCKSSVSENIWNLENVQGADDSDTCIDGNYNIVRYGKLERSGTTLTNTIYSDAARTIPVVCQSGTNNPQTVTTDATTHRYIMVAPSHNDSIAGTTFSGSISEVDLTGSGSPAEPVDVRSVVINGTSISGGGFP